MNRLEAALQGRLAEYMEAEIDGGAVASTRAAKRIAPRMLAEVRGHIAAAHGPKNAKSWKAQVYPSSGNALDAAVFQYDASAGDWVIRSITESGPIRARNGRWIALPTEAALSVLPKRLHHSRSNRGRGGSADSAVGAIEKRFGALQFVYLPRQRRAYLIAEVRATSRRLKSGATRRGFGKARRTKTGRAAKNVQTVVMFVLVPQVRRASGKAVNLDRLAEKYLAEFAQAIADEWPEILR